MSELRPNVAEFICGFVMAHFGRELKRCYDYRRRPAQDCAPIYGIDVPSRRLLAVFVVAGAEGVSLLEALEHTKVGNDWVGKLDSADTLLGNSWSNGVEFKPALLDQLADGLGADSEQRQRLRAGCKGGGAYGKADSERIKEVLDDECRAIAASQTKKLTDAAAAEKHQRGQTNEQCLDFCARSAAGLSALPPYYPRHMTVTSLAGRLTASILEEGWEKTYTLKAGLYSGLSFNSEASATAIVAQHRRSVLLGDPGHGKSTVLAACCLVAVAEQRLSLFARLDDLGEIAAAKKSPGILRTDQAVELVIEAAEAFSGVACPPSVRSRLVDSILHDDAVLLAFDGLDEIVVQSSRAAAEKVLRALSDIPGTIAISSRITGYTKPINEATELLVDRMGESAVKDFVSSWFTPSETDLRDQTLTALSDSDLSELARIPLLAGFVCYVSSHQAVETTKHGLYQQYLGLFFERRWKPTEKQRLTSEDKNRILALATTVAWAMATRPAADPSDPPLWADHISLRELAFDPKIRGNAAELTETDGLLIPHGQLRQGDLLGQQYRWLHRTIHEHLAGLALANWIKRDFDSTKAFLKSAALRSTWTVALEHCSGLLGNDPSTTKVADYLFQLHYSEDTVNDTFAGALTTVLEYSGSAHRRRELTEEAFTKGYFLPALHLDRKYTQKLLLERPPSVLEVEPWIYDRLGKEFAASQIEILSEAARREPRRYSSDWISLLSMVDEDAARRSSIRCYLDRTVEQIHSVLFEELDPAQGSWMIDLLPQARNSYRLFSLASVIHLFGDESIRTRLEEVTLDWGVEGALLRSYYKELDGAAESRDALRLACGKVPRYEMSEIAAASYGKFLAVLAGACWSGSAPPTSGSSWFRFGALLKLLYDDSTYLVPYDRTGFEAHQAAQLISEIEVIAGLDPSNDANEVSAEALLQFHAAVEQITQDRNPTVLPALISILEKSSQTDAFEDFSITNPSWLSEKIKRYSWEEVFASFKSSSAVVAPVHLGAHFEIRNIVDHYIFEHASGVTGKHENERLLQWIEWIVNGPGDPDLMNFSKLPAAVDHIDRVLRIIHGGHNRDNQIKMLSKVERWADGEDLVPQYQKLLSFRPR